LRRHHPASAGGDRDRTYEQREENRSKIKFQESDMSPIAVPPTEMRSPATGILPESAKDNRKEIRLVETDSRNKKMAGLQVGTVGGEPTVQVARPGLGTGAVSLGGGDLSALLAMLSKLRADKISL
jgi:hypothetical protein